jgi:hypothetical protein
MSDEIALPVSFLWEDTRRLRTANLSELDENARLALRGYLAELSDDRLAADLHYQALSDDNSVWVRNWSYVRRAALGKEPAGSGCTVEMLRVIESSAIGWLAVEAAWTAGRLQVEHDLGAARTALDRALSKAMTLLPPAAAGELQVDRELVGAIWIELIGILLRKGRTFLLEADIERALRLFRNYRRSLDACSREAERHAAPCRTLRLEFVSAAEEPILVVATDAKSECWAFLNDTGEIGAAMRRYQDRLHAADRLPQKSLEWLVLVNRSLLQVRNALERLLFRLPLRWNDGRRASIDDVIAECGHAEIVGHGPTRLVPWSLLRRADGRCLGEVASITMPPTDVFVPRPATENRSPVVIELADGDTAGSMLERVGVNGVVWLRGHGKFSCGDPLSTVLMSLDARRRIQASDLLTVGRPLEHTMCVFASLCEAAETHRRCVAFDFMSLAYALLATGPHFVIAPTTTITSASDDLVRSAINKVKNGESPPVAWQSVVSPHLAEWRVDEASPQHIESAWAAGRPPPSDLAAFVVLCAAGSH